MYLFQKLCILSYNIMMHNFKEQHIHSKSMLGTYIYTNHFSELTMSQNTSQSLITHRQPKSLSMQFVRSLKNTIEPLIISCHVIKYSETIGDAID